MPTWRREAEPGASWASLGALAESIPMAGGRAPWCPGGLGAARLPQIFGGLWRLEVNPHCSVHYIAECPMRTG